MTTTTAQDHLAWLQDKLAAYESKLADAESVVARLRPTVLNLRGTIDAIISDERGPSPPKGLFDDQHLNNGAQNPAASRSKPHSVHGKPFAVGNQHPDMPPRQPQFADCTLMQASGKIINNAPETLHADAVTRAVFVIDTKEQFKLAKHSMSSELYRGAKKGFWQAMGDNRYRRN